MEILELIRKRRSVRKYKKELPEEAKIKKVLESARWAPSGLNNQPWRFLVIKDKLQKNGLAEFTKYGQTIKDAPVAIVVCMDVADSYNYEKDLMAIGACIANMLLEATALGLGSCWLGEILNKKTEVLRYLKLPGDLELMAVVVLGIPDEMITESCRKPLSTLMIKS
jgi:nitroreductase